MASKITNEMRNDLAAHQGVAVPVVDDQTNQIYFLVDEISMQHMQSVAGMQDPQQRQRLKTLIQEGIDSEHIPAEEAEPRMRAMIQKYADKIQ